MSKDSRAGGKYTGTHTSLIPLAAELCDKLHELSEVTKISPGFIKGGLKGGKSPRSIKVKTDQGSLLLIIRDKSSVQEVRVYVRDIEIAQTALKTFAHEHTIRIIIRSDQQESLS